MNFIKIVAPIICTFFLAASPTLADGEKAPEDKSTKRNINKQIQSWDDFIQDLKLVRDSQGNVSYGQCMTRAEKRRKACQETAQSGDEYARCYKEEDEQREWCGRAWDNIIDP